MLQRLQWPANRNELLQILIRKKWTSAMFDSFCDILRQKSSTATFASQSNQVLAEKLRQALTTPSDNGRRRMAKESNGGKFQLSCSMKMDTCSISFTRSCVLQEKNRIIGTGERLLHAAKGKQLHINPPTPVCIRRLSAVEEHAAGLSICSQQWGFQQLEPS